MGERFARVTGGQACISWVLGGIEKGLIIHPSCFISFSSQQTSAYTRYKPIDQKHTNTIYVLSSFSANPIRISPRSKTTNCAFNASAPNTANPIASEL